jgi:sterol desaturase/sphingolipid hydroxylase (fatty acid hydroxylase superfamily)
MPRCIRRATRQVAQPDRDQTGFRREGSSGTGEEAPPERVMLPFVLATAAFIIFTAAEARRPLRNSRESKLRRTGRNLAVAGITAALTAAVQRAVLAPVARKTTERRLGLLNQLRAPRPVRIAAGVLLLDYTLWWWHRANHRVPLLWRFHLVHHVDLDLDSSTALRFHFGEMALSVFFRAAQFRLLGIDPIAASLWQTALLVSILFHHSNLRLPVDVERRLANVLVTPRMHGIHHSDVRDETDSNWSSLLSCWDFLHHTFRFDVPQSAITIGVPAWQQSDDVTFCRILAMPFEDQRDDWTDDDGRPHLIRSELTGLPS